MSALPIDVCGDLKEESVMNSRVAEPIATLPSEVREKPAAKPKAEETYTRSFTYHVENGILSRLDFPAKRAIVLSIDAR